MDTAIREKALRDMRRDYPETPMFLLEMTYDYVTKHPEQAERIINGQAEIPSAKKRDTDMGKCVVYKDEDEMERIEKNVGRIEKIVSGN
jgi:hypothetical protein